MRLHMHVSGVRLCVHIIVFPLIVMQSWKFAFEHIYIRLCRADPALPATTSIPI